MGTELYNHASVHADRREIPIQGQKIHTFPYRGLPPGGGGLPSHAIHFGKLSSSQ